MRFAGSDSAMASLFGGVKSPEYDELANLGTKARAQEEQAAMEADSFVAQSRNKARAIEEGAKYAAEATRAQGQANMFSGAMGALGSLGSAGIGAMQANNDVKYHIRDGSTWSAKDATEAGFPGNLVNSDRRLMW
jgi:hypothetical protein